MKKKNIQVNPVVAQIFDDLEKYREFCVEYGYVYDEGSVYDPQNSVNRQFQKFLKGKDVKNNWVEDQKKYDLL
jgi:hypothetical protein